MRRRGAETRETVERLARRVEELEQELRARRAIALPGGAPGWQDDAAVPADEPEDDLPHQWLSILEAPVRRRRRLPRLPFEVLFLAGCAVAAGVADLDPLWIAAVMGGAWLLVALTEWSATLADRRRAGRDAVPPPALVPTAARRADQAWYIPPVEQTFVQGAGAAAPAAGEATAITRPPRVAPDELESTMVRPRAVDAADTQA